MKVYVVKYKSYYSYSGETHTSIDCVFDTEEKAMEYVKANGQSTRWYDYEYEVFDVA